MTIMIQENLIDEAATSTSPKNLTAQTLIKMMTTQKILIHAAVGTLSVQKLSTVTTPYTSQIEPYHRPGDDEPAVHWPR